MIKNSTKLVPVKHMFLQLPLRFGAVHSVQAFSYGATTALQSEKA